MRVLGLLGWSGSGKTTLLTALLPRLIETGLSVSTVKHAHHAFDIDQPGKDSFEHRKAGAREVLISSGKRWALIHERANDPGAPEPTLPDLLTRLAPVDLVIVEGFKTATHKKLEIHRPSTGAPPLWPGRSDVLAVASDQNLPHCHLPVLDLAKLDSIVVWVTGFVRADDASQHGA
jgi:molybdopterin-guanine dinucleotide biosynthesis protein B